MLSHICSAPGSVFILPTRARPGSGQGRALWLCSCVPPPGARCPFTGHAPDQVVPLETHALIPRGTLQGLQLGCYGPCFLLLPHSSCFCCTGLPNLLPCWPTSVASPCFISFWHLLVGHVLSSRSHRHLASCKCRREADGAPRVPAGHPSAPAPPGLARCQCVAHPGWPCSLPPTPPTTSSLSTTSLLSQPCTPLAVASCQQAPLSFFTALAWRHSMAPVKGITADQQSR